MAVTNNIAPVIAAVGGEELNFPTESRRTFELLRRERDGSKYHGVEWAKYTRKWKAHILNLNARNGHSTFLGYFEDEIEAARAYDRAMLSMPREKAVAKKNNYRGDGTLAVPSQSPLSISKKTIGAVAAAHAGSNHSRTSNVTTINTCTADEQLNFPSERASNTVKWGGKSQYRGVCWSSRDNKWLAQIHCTKRAGRARRQIGLFTSEEDAAWAYDKAALELHGAEAHLNFPQPEHQRQLQASSSRPPSQPAPPSRLATGATAEATTSFVGRRVRKWFTLGWFDGTVLSLDQAEGLWLVEYSDDDREENTDESLNTMEIVLPQNERINC